MYVRRNVVKVEFMHLNLVIHNMHSKCLIFFKHDFSLTSDLFYGGNYSVIIYLNVCLGVLYEFFFI